MARQEGRGPARTKFSIASRVRVFSWSRAPGGPHASKDGGGPAGRGRGRAAAGMGGPASRARAWYRAEGTRWGAPGCALRPDRRGAAWVGSGGWRLVRGCAFVPPRESSNSPVGIRPLVCEQPASACTASRVRRWAVGDAASRVRARRRRRRIGRRRPEGPRARSGLDSAQLSGDRDGKLCANVA